MNKRNVGFKNSNSKDGTVSVRISSEMAGRLKTYGKSVNESASTVVNKALKEYLDNEQARMLEAMSKEDLINFILNR